MVGHDDEGLGRFALQPQQHAIDCHLHITIIDKEEARHMISFGEAQEEGGEVPLGRSAC